MISIKRCDTPVTMHQPSFSTCIKPNSNGVFLPKILTITFNLRFSLLTSSITPLKPLKGPSITFTVSSTTYGIFTSSTSSVSSAVPSIRFMSACGTGDHRTLGGRRNHGTPGSKRSGGRRSVSPGIGPDGARNAADCRILCKASERARPGCPVIASRG